MFVADPADVGACVITSHVGERQCIDSGYGVDDHYTLGNTNE